MAYATVANVEALNKGRPPFGATSARGESTVDDVVGWLEETAGVIDGLLRQKGYVLPVPTTAATAALKTLENLNAIGAAYLVERGAKNSDRLEDARRMWESAKKMLAEGVVELELPFDVEETRPRSGFGRTSSAATPYFTRDMVL